tara:strand:+ start:1648 stop:2394 length:747 start_codon:yes stop_codon:yes gene_type:complete
MIYIVANWKMNKDSKQSKFLMNEIDCFDFYEPSMINVIISPPTIYLSQLKNSKSNLAAQNISHHSNGPYTGEISSKMVSEYVSYVIIGHSERRRFFCETDEFISKKINQCNNENLKSIVCFGESLEIRNKSNHLDFIRKQLNHIINSYDISNINNLMLAYEPVWAIGSGNSATIQEICEVHDFTRGILNDIFGKIIGNSVPIIYGGSCTKINAKSILANLNVNGLLIGGASLDLLHFKSIIKEANEVT